MKNLAHEKAPLVWEQGLIIRVTGKRRHASVTIRFTPKSNFGANYYEFETRFYYVGF